MTAEIKRSVDEIGMKILLELQKNARISFSEIGRKVGLSSPAVAERVYKMEETGILTGYHADINPEVFGHHILAFISLTTRSDMYQDVYLYADKSRQIIECHHISGSESLILKAVSGSISQLDTLVEALGKFGETKTSIVLSSPIQKKQVQSIKQ